jgi:hypothetical protein
MKTIVLAASMLALLAIAATAATAGSAYPGTRAPHDMPYVEPGGPDGCGSPPVDIGNANYDGACDPAQAVDVSAEYNKTVDGAVVRCRVIEEKITYRAKIAKNKIWEYVQQVEWCWNGVTIRRVDRIRFPRLSAAGTVFWDFKGHTASSCVSNGDYSPCRELAGRPTAYIATQGKFQTVLCGLKFFPCITKLPGMWVKISSVGRVLGYGGL